MSVVGLDLSLTGTGIAALVASQGKKPKLHTTCVTSRGRRNDDLAHRHQRLRTLRDEITRRVGKPDLVVVEGPGYSRAAGSGHHDGAGLWWAVVSSLMDAGTAIAVAPPSSRAKWATGKGNADKTTVTLGLARLLPLMGRLHPGPFVYDGTADWEEEPPEVGGEDEADASVLALMGVHALGDLPDVMRTNYRDDALLGVAWPDRDSYNRVLAPYARAERVK